MFEFTTFQVYLLHYNVIFSKRLVSTIKSNVFGKAWLHKTQSYSGQLSVPLPSNVGVNCVDVSNVDVT